VCESRFRDICPKSLPAFDPDQSLRGRGVVEWSELRREDMMKDIKVDETLWASSIMPEGTVERWFIADGAAVAAGDRISEVRIEDALHDITAPAGGRLTIVSGANTVVEPGSLLARLATD
jgi:hypothetical protein